MTRRHYSPSQIGTFSRCPRQWYYRYVEGLIVPPGGAMVMGSSVHEAAETHHLDRIRGGAGLDEDAFVGAADDAFAARADEVEWDREPDDRGRVLDRTVAIAHRVHSGVLPVIRRPTRVEHRLDTAVPGAEWTLRTVLDVVEDLDDDGHRVGIRDLKTKARAVAGAAQGMPMPDAAHVRQLHLYGYALRAHGLDGDGTEPVALALDYAWPKDTAIVPIEYDLDEVRMTLEDVETMHRTIAAGLFCRNRDGWHCSPRWCGYYDRCLGAVGLDL